MLCLKIRNIGKLGGKTLYLIGREHIVEGTNKSVKLWANIVVDVHGCFCVNMAADLGMDL